MNFDNKGSLASRGGRCMILASAGSNARARDKVTAVTMLTHSTCTGVMGSVTPNRMAATITNASAPLVGKVNNNALRRLS